MKWVHWHSFWSEVLAEQERRLSEVGLVLANPVGELHLGSSGSRGPAMLRVIVQITN